MIFKNILKSIALNNCTEFVFEGEKKKNLVVLSYLQEVLRQCGHVIKEEAPYFIFKLNLF